MSHTLADRFRRWFEYERDSHAEVLTALEASPETARATREFERAVSLMAHVVQARRGHGFRVLGARGDPATGAGPSLSTRRHLVARPTRGASRSSTAIP